MNTLEVPRTRNKSHIRLNRNSRLFKTIIKAIQEKKGEQLISLDLRKIPEAVTDFFIICEASNHIQVRAIAEYIEEEVKAKTGENPYRHEGFGAMKWVLIDYITIVIHIFQPENRRFYNLEEIWSDAEGVSHQE